MTTRLGDARIWWRRHWPIVRFVALYLSLILVFQIVYYDLIVSSRPFGKYLEGSGKAAAALLGVTGEDVVVRGDVMSGGFSMSIKQGCDGLQAMAILVIGVLVFPGTWRWKSLGIVLGVGLLLGLNIVRIATLFWAGEHARSAFQILHVHVWPALLIICALAFWVRWALSATRNQAVG